METFRLAQSQDIDAIFAIIEQARAAIGALGIDQWQNGYPNRDSISQDIATQNCYVLEKDGNILTTAALCFGPEPTYATIYQGQWHSDTPYATIHRIASSDTSRGSGAAHRMLAHLQNTCRNKNVYFLRIDTHPGNTPMQRFLSKNDFAYCGIIYIGGDDATGSKRFAYDKNIVK